MKKREIVDVIDREGFAPFLAVDTVWLDQPENKFEMWCTCVVDTYLESYGFAVGTDGSALGAKGAGGTPEEERG